MSSSPKSILHIAGWTNCGFYRRASSVLTSLNLLFPTRIEVETHEFGSRDEYRNWLMTGPNAFRDAMNDERAKKHTSSPFTWIEKPETKNFVGGCDDTLAWCKNFCSPRDEVKEGCVMVPDGHENSHPYEYDLVVIGGGSGGLAASKEAAALGARTAVLDFVKPSPQGSTWGLGGTCVNVGCIPKKLMHNAALIQESLHADSAAFGISLGEQAPVHDWEAMRENIQNHIRGLNFKYRVNLREKSVTYLNKLGKFIDPHTIEVIDKKGNVSTITSSRFLVAVGGRPTDLDCEGKELAISSDDIFSLAKAPGKTLCVGASYISLECAGFLAGLGYDTTVAVRSILLRGFDRECAEKIGAYMEDNGVKFRNGVVPKKLEKIEGSESIQVTFSDDSQDVYDTVLVAIGRSADTEMLGLDKVGVLPNSKNGKIPTKFEQTTCPNIYAIGDVMEGCPELTPVAIQAGVALSRRLFSDSTKPMDYQSICTTVFTPIEYGTVGISEEDAMSTYGKQNVEVYHKSFIPLEWSLSVKRQAHQAFCKVICDKSDNLKILGIHFLGPNAGEVTQGYGVAMKKSLYFKDFEETVGIHPTSAEELVTLAVTKNSGEDAAAGGC